MQRAVSRPRRGWRRTRPERRGKRSCAASGPSKPPPVSEDAIESAFEEAAEETDVDEERRAREEHERDLATERARRRKFLELEKGSADRSDPTTGELSTFQTELAV